MEKRFLTLSERMKLNNPMFNKISREKMILTTKKNWEEKNKIISNIEPSEDVRQVLLGSFLGDATLQRTRNHNVIFREFHCFKQKNYLLWKANILSEFFGKFNVYIYSKRKQIQIRFGANPYLNKWYELLYPTNKKRKIDKKLIEELKPLGLAVWFMDDGSKNNNGNYILTVSNNQNRELVTYSHTLKGGAFTHNFTFNWA